MKTSELVSTFISVHTQFSTSYKTAMLIIYNITSRNGLLYCDLQTDSEKQTLWSLVRKRTIPTGQPPLVNEI
jgi:hypothetical protein